MWLQNTMNSLKKGFKKFLSYWYILLLIVPVVIIILISCSNKSENVDFITENNSYILLNDQKDISIPIYINDKYSFYLDTKNINNVYILNNDESDRYELKITDIVKTESYITKDKNDFPRYLLKAKFEYTGSEIRMSEAFILLEYNNGETHKLKIGNFIYLNVELNNHINVYNVKGIVNKVIPKDNEWLLSTVGVIIKISSDYEIIIKDIELIHGNGRVNKDQITRLKENDYDNNVNINELVIDEYRINYINTSMEKIYIDENEILLLPIGYNNLDVIDTLGVLIEYEYENNIYKQIIYPMPIFNNNKNVEYNLYEYNPN